MKPSLSPRAAAAAAVSCVAVFATTGCVSQKEFSQACRERDQVAAALTTTRADRARLTTELAETWAQRDAAWQDSEDLSVVLQAALDRSSALERRSTETQATLDDAKTSLATAHRELTSTRQSLVALEHASATAREQLAATQKRAEELDTAVRAGQVAIAQLRTQARAQAEEAAARIKQAQLDLAEAAKDQAALVMTREKLTRSEQSDAQARESLAQAEQSGAQLASRLESAASEILKLKNEAQTRDVQSVAAHIAQAQVAASATRKIQAELDAARTKQAETQRAAEDAKAQLAGSVKRVADLEVKVRTLAAQPKRTPGEGEAKPASDSTAAVNPNN